MSSGEDYSSSSAGDDDEDGSEYESEPQRQAAPASRRNARRYTTADIDREIATQQKKEEEIEDGDDDDDGNDDNDDDSDASAAEEEGESEDEKPKPKRRGGAIKSSVRRTGAKQVAKKASPKRGGNKKLVAKKRAPPRKKDSFIAGNGSVDDDDDNEEEEASSEDSPDDDDGGEWNASDANDSSGGSEEDEEESSDSDYGAPRRSKKKAGAKKRTAAKKKLPTKPRAKLRAAPARRSTRATRSAHKELSSEGKEEEIQYETTPGGSRRPRRQCRSTTQQKMHDMVQADMRSEREALADVLEEDDRELLENSDRGGNSSSEGEDETGRVAVDRRNGMNGSGKKAAATPKKRGNKYDDDESYDEGAPSDTNDDSDDDDMSDFEESDDGVSNRNTRKSSRKKSSKRGASYKDVDESDFGTADEDSDDATAGPSILLSPAGKGSLAMGGGSPNSRRRARAGRTPLDVREGVGSDEESDDGGDEDYGGDGGKKETASKDKKFRPKKKRRKLSAGSDDDEGEAGEGSDDSGEEDAPRNQRHALLKNTISPTTLKSTHVNCPSKTDDITMTTLPKNKPHLCYIAPDGKTRHCFALDTLYRIAISSSTNDSNSAAENALAALDAKKLKFLQPPHFRSPMEDDLLDQIASRFGRGALVIEKSAVYKKMMGQSVGGRYAASLDEDLDEFDEDGEYVGYDETGAQTRNFRDRFERYMQNLMGSMDVYCCPLCYNEADRRLGNGGDEEMWEDDENSANEGEESEDHFSFLDDPLTILGSLDAERFEVAASFCFRLLSGLKTHLKVVHGVKVSDVEGNDLYKRFQIRASDGLLQSWLKKSLRQNTVQGDMMRYWLNGENQSFVLLLSQIDRNGLRGEQSGEFSSDFSASFPNRARRVWRDVSAPYLKDTQDMGDFLAEDGEEEESGDDEEGGGADGVPVNPNFTPPNAKGEELKSPEEQMIEHLQKKNRGRPEFDDTDDSSSGEENDDGDGSSEEGLEVLPKPPQYEEAEEEDEWTKSKTLKAKKARQSNLKSDEGNRDDDSSEDDSVFDSNNNEEKPDGGNGIARKRVIDEGNGLDSDANTSKPHAQTNGSARKRVMESSDEESD